MRRIPSDNTIVDIYEFYKKTVEPELQLSWKDFKKVCYDGNKLIWDAILSDSATFRVYGRLGDIRIQKKKMNLKNGATLRVDHAETKRLNKIVYHLNEHRDHYRYKVYWSKSTAIFQNKNWYSFTATRTNKRRLAKILKTMPEIDYFE